MSVKSSSSLALACLVLLFSSGCASSGIAKLVTVDGKHLLAKSCTERQRLEEAIAEAQERRRPLTEEITQARKAVAEVGRPLELSSVAVEGPQGGFRCTREVDLQPERPPLARIRGGKPQPLQIEAAHCTSLAVGSPAPSLKQRCPQRIEV